MTGVDVTDMLHFICDGIHAPAVCLLLTCLVDGGKDPVTELLQLLLGIGTEVKTDLGCGNDGMDRLKASRMEVGHCKCRHGICGNTEFRDLGNGSGRRMERVCHLSKHAARMAADSVEVHLIRLDACGLISDLLVAGSVHGNAGLQLRMMVHIILHSL